MNKKFAIIGGGIIGLATAYRLMQSKLADKIVIFEKEDNLGKHQSSHNSGVLHAGLYYKPGSTKAVLAVNGIRQMIQFCQKEEIPHKICGKLVVATDNEEIHRLQNLFKQGNENGLVGLRLLDSRGIRLIEPYVNGVAAIHVPEEGIVDYPAVCKALARKIQEQGGEIKLNSRAKKISSFNDEWIIQTGSDEYACDFIINCAGLHCDRVARMAGEKPDMQIVPFRGDYYKIKKERNDIVKNLVYPVPNPEFPFLGVHFTRMINGDLEAGPNAVLAFSREGYNFFQINPADLIEALTFRGLRKFLFSYPKMVRRELAISLSKSYFCKQLQRLVPDIRRGDLEKGNGGVRAQALDLNGNLLQDFNILARKNALHVLNAPSPGATASLAIGEYIVSLLPG